MFNLNDAIVDLVAGENGAGVLKANPCDNDLVAIAEQHPHLWNLMCELQGRRAAMEEAPARAEYDEVVEERDAYERDYGRMRELVDDVLAEAIEANDAVADSASELVDLQYEYLEAIIDMIEEAKRAAGADW